MRISDWSSACALPILVISSNDGTPRGSGQPMNEISRKGTATTRATRPRSDTTHLVTSAPREEGATGDGIAPNEIGREAWRDRVCQEVLIQVVAGAVHDKRQMKQTQ